MSEHRANLTRRDFLKGSSLLGAAPLDSWTAAEPAKNNVILIISDQFRWDCVGANKLNPLNLTPHIDSMAREGVNFENAITNQPVCAPSRACLFTGVYPNKHGVWRNGIPLRPESFTIARSFRQAGYTANYIGKWHLAPENAQDPSSFEAVPPEYRGGFDDFWEGCNVLEHTSHPYEGSIWDGAGQQIRFSNRYRVDFITDRVLRFLSEKARQPFFLVISYLEPHFQNDCNCFVAPKGYADRYRNSFIPRDLSFFPGDWQEQLPDYYGCIASVDENVGRLREELQRLKLRENTVVAFTSDHGCHFRTRNQEYKRSGHESSIHLPLVIAGPGFTPSFAVKELVSQIDLGPTLLNAVGIAAPPAMQGRNAMGLLKGGASGWRNEVLIYISESMTARALRTPQWSYVVAEPSGKSQLQTKQYTEYQLYDLFSDPHELVNLCGRHETREISAHLRERLMARIVEAGEQAIEILPAPLYP
ncbi:MAG: sulfatase [Candidatus Acidiferrum sp.]